MDRSCPACGQQLDGDVRFCTACGHPVAPAPQPRRRRAAVAALAAIGSLAVIALGGAYLLRSGAAPTPRDGRADGRWSFSESEDGMQVLFTRSGGEALFRVACDPDDGTLWMNSQALPDADVEKRSEARHALDLVLAGGGMRRTVEGYVSRSPEGASVSWETPHTPELLTLLAASDLVLSGPGLALNGGAPPLAAFARACPAPASPDADGWGTLTSRANGYRLAFPRGLLRLAAGDRGGRRYVSDSGNAELTIGAQANALDQTLLEAARTDTLALPRLDKQTYRAEDARTIVLSGLAGGRIVHFKARATCNKSVFAWFRLSYDEAARATFDPVVARMAKSFDATAMPDGTAICP